MSLWHSAFLDKQEKHITHVLYASPCSHLGWRESWIIILSCLTCNSKAYPICLLLSHVYIWVSFLASLLIWRWARVNFSLKALAILSLETYNILSNSGHAMVTSGHDHFLASFLFFGTHKIMDSFLPRSLSKWWEDTCNPHVLSCITVSRFWLCRDCLY